MLLVKPSLKYKRSFQNALKEFITEGRKTEGDPKDIEGYLKKTRLFDKGVNLPKGKVPASTFWLIDKSSFIGRVSIRKKLNKNLRAQGGHIGYAIRPSKRKMGYGSKILELALKKTKKLHINKVLITCNENNLASQKIIEKNGGQLHKRGVYDGVKIRLYYIKL